MPRHKPFPERFWDKVEKSCGCWIWKGKKSDSGYGIVYVSASRRRMAHRVALELSSGEAVPDEIDVLHSCDNPPCVNPAHLFLGTHTDNMRDMVAKGRSGRGSRNSRAKLTVEDVLRVRGLRASKKPREIAQVMGIQIGQIYRILGRRRWGHVQ